MVVSNENMHTDKSDPDSSNDNGKIFADSIRMQLRNPEGPIASGTEVSNDEKENKLTNCIQSKMTGDKELEDTKSLEFKPEKRPENAIQGDVIRFMYSPNSDPSAPGNAEQ